MTESQRINWLRQRSIGRNNRNLLAGATVDSMQRLGLENSLEAHSGCVNCLEWNQNGTLLASGSDDRNVIVWNPFEQVKKNIVSTGHEGNIFSVKFMTEMNETILATCASDGHVKLTDIQTSKNLFNCRFCHIDRVKRLATHSREPYLCWSAGEEGYIIQHDVRESHSCRLASNKPKNLLIDLSLSSLSAKCLAINPMRNEMLAVGSNDTYIRLYDRRYLKPNSCTHLIAYFTPGHMNRRRSPLRSSNSCGTTYVSFSSNGSELLANMHAEQIYLFNTYEPVESFKSFDVSIKPLILDQPLTPVNRTQTRFKPHSEWRKLKQLNKYSELDSNCQILQRIQGAGDKSPVSLSDINSLNELLVNVPDCPELYNLRARLLIERGWRGDHWQAIRDCYCALALKPLNLASIESLAKAALCLRDKEIARGILDMTEMIQREFGPSAELDQAVSCVKDCLSIPSWMLARNVIYDETTLLDPIQTLGSHKFHENMTDKLTNQHNDFNLEAPSNEFDFSKRFSGHCNMNTDIKESNFFGDFIVAGSDDGAFYIWDKKTTNIVKAVHADHQILNCVQPHPTICMLATSGIEPVVKIWSTIGKALHDVALLQVRCDQNQSFLSADPIEAMMMMLYPDRNTVS